MRLSSRFAAFFAFTCVGQNKLNELRCSAGAGSNYIDVVDGRGKTGADLFYCFWISDGLLVRCCDSPDFTVLRILTWLKEHIRLWGSSSGVPTGYDLITC